MSQINSVFFDLRNNYNTKIDNKKDLTDKVKIYVKHPFFMGLIIKNYFGEKFPCEIKNDLLNLMAECNLRGLLSEENSFEFYDNTQNKKIDYVNYAMRKAVKFNIRKTNISK